LSTECATERILKIGQYLAKIWTLTKSEVLGEDTVYKALRTTISSCQSTAWCHSWVSDSWKKRDIRCLDMKFSSWFRTQYWLR